MINGMKCQSVHDHSSVRRNRPNLLATKVSATRSTTPSTAVSTAVPVMLTAALVDSNCLSALVAQGLTLPSLRGIRIVTRPSELLTHHYPRQTPRKHRGSVRLTRRPSSRINRARNNNSNSRHPETKLARTKRASLCSPTGPGTKLAGVYIGRH